MNIGEILSHCDHTLLAVDAGWEDIRRICDEGVKYKTASVCIPACYVKQAAEYLNGKTAVCTVIGFPLGYMTTAAKAFEATDAVSKGADEIDMVVNLCHVKNGQFFEVTNEIKEIKASCRGKTLKVIVEACYLTEEEKVKLCKCVTEAGADFIKTSTGFGTGGATPEDVKLFKENIGENVRIKAAGGIKTKEEMEKYIELGCSRIGASSAVKALS